MYFLTHPAATKICRSQEAHFCEVEGRLLRSPYYSTVKVTFVVRSSVPMVAVTTTV